MNLGRIAALTILYSWGIDLQVRGPWRMYQTSKRPVLQAILADGAYRYCDVSAKLRGV